MTVVAFSGSRHGMSDRQRQHVFDTLWYRPAGEALFVHGGCVGADETAHVYAVSLGWDVVVFPCTIESARAPIREHTISRPSVFVHRPMPPLERNALIVKGASVLVACPDGPERMRSGTWSTVRRARAAGVTVVAVLPDGTVIAS